MESSRTGKTHLCLKISEKVLPPGKEDSPDNGTIEIGDGNAVFLDNALLDVCIY